MLYPVEDHRPHRHLAAVGLAPGLGRDHPGQQRRAVLLAAAPPAAGGHAKRLEGGRPGDAIGGQAVLPLKVFDRLGRLTAVDAIHRAVIVAPIFQLGLDGPHLLTAGALPVGGRLGLLGQGDHRNIHHKQKGQRPRQPPLLRHAFASIPGNSVRRQTGGYERQFFPAAGIGILKSGHTGRKQERMCPGW